MLDIYRIYMVDKYNWFSFTMVVRFYIEFWNEKVKSLFCKVENEDIRLGRPLQIPMLNVWTQELF